MASVEYSTGRLVRPRARRSKARRAVARAALVALVLAGGLAGFYVAARETSLFAVRSVEVKGAPDAAIARAVREALEPLVGESLATLGAKDVERLVANLPDVHSVTVDRAFPHGLRVTVQPERPLAVIRQGAEAWLVSATGRVLRQLEPEALARLPRVWLPRADPLSPGTFVLEGEGGAAIRALARVPAGFPLRIIMARDRDKSVTVIVGEDDRIELRLGDPQGLRLKLEVAAHILESLPMEERARLAYLDVSVPTRPVAADKSQVVA